MFYEVAEGAGIVAGHTHVDPGDILSIAGTAIAAIIGGWATDGP